jgi:CDP-glucose 4,6-dehydratase
VETLGVGRLPDAEFWSGQRVFLTGHSGFKGAWLAVWLGRMGARTFGLSLPPETTPNLFDLLQPIDGLAESRFGDIRDLQTVKDAITAADPTIAIHMAAQPLVRRSYREPLETFAANVMGTANVLDALRDAPNLKSVLVITTDKVYRNNDDGKPFVEDDPLGGHDPYSASKAACELVVQSWSQSYFEAKNIRVAAARAGNVVGGGDWSEDRLVPDLWRAAKAGTPVTLRYPNATRPWQHVLDPLNGYLVYTEALTTSRDDVPAALNFGPLSEEVLTVGEVARTVLKAMKSPVGIDISNEKHEVEMQKLALDAGAASKALGWKPGLPSQAALTWTADWYRLVNEGRDAKVVTREQIDRFCGRAA